ncbi:toxic anion resistance protein [Fusibacillus kribbianus]|uniref:Toxic anion resistance protein n=1 Tax=Fusibacillus kribbianus TaxID=3044208 RepID=A0AAP4B7F3_9FIRM|nr:toxic anion resistance protein [Ruminococcus sp. YH-rum2234]MDI9241169.1 toxic anion resistance protein [Ruminococcus sp. YH-rum2234]
MEKDLDLMEKTPTLTLTPFAEEKKEPLTVTQTPEETQLDDSMLSEEEKKMVEAFAGQIDLSDSAAVLQYGAGAQKKMADFSETALDNVKTKDLGEVGTLLSDVVTELKSFDAEEEKGFLGFFKKSSNKLTAMKAKYAKAEVNVDRICQVLEGHQVQLLKDAAMLDKMYELNLTYFKELTMYILAGKKKLKKVQTEELPALLARAEKSSLPEDAQAARDLDARCKRFEKKLHDLELTRMISMQTAPQIRLVQDNDTVMVEKIQSTIVNTVPLWKNQMVLALGAAHSAQAAEAQKKVSDMTNELLMKNAAALKTVSAEVARESERGVVDMETIRSTNETLISTLDEVLQIQAEGRQKRAEAEVEMKRLENDLKTKLLEIASR